VGEPPRHAPSRGEAGASPRVHGWEKRSLSRGAGETLPDGRCALRGGRPPAAPSPLPWVARDRARSFGAPAASRLPARGRISQERRARPCHGQPVTRAPSRRRLRATPPFVMPLWWRRSRRPRAAGLRPASRRRRAGHRQPPIRPARSQACRTQRPRALRRGPSSLP
jgi:hypothetical protein